MWQDSSSWVATKRVLQAVEGNCACPNPGVHAPEVRAVLVSLVPAKTMARTMNTPTSVCSSACTS